MITYNMPTYDMIFLKFSQWHWSSDPTYEWTLRKQLNNWMCMYISRHSFKNCLKEHSFLNWPEPKNNFCQGHRWFFHAAKSKKLSCHPFFTQLWEWTTHTFLTLSHWLRSLILWVPSYLPGHSFFALLSNSFPSRKPYKKRCLLHAYRFERYGTGKIYGFYFLCQE